MPGTRDDVASQHKPVRASAPLPSKTEDSFFEKGKCLRTRRVRHTSEGRGQRGETRREHAEAQGRKGAGKGEQREKESHLLQLLEVSKTDN